MEVKSATQLHVEAGLGMRGALFPLYTPYTVIASIGTTFPFLTRPFPQYDNELPEPQYSMNKR